MNYELPRGVWWWVFKYFVFSIYQVYTPVYIKTERFTSNHLKKNLKYIDIILRQGMVRMVNETHLRIIEGITIGLVSGLVAGMIMKFDIFGTEIFHLSFLLTGILTFLSYMWLRDAIESKSVIGITILGTSTVVLIILSILSLLVVLGVLG